MRSIGTGTLFGRLTFFSWVRYFGKYLPSNRLFILMLIFLTSFFWDALSIVIECLEKLCLVNFPYPCSVLSKFIRCIKPLNFRENFVLLYHQVCVRGRLHELRCVISFLFSVESLHLNINVFFYKCLSFSLVMEYLVCYGKVRRFKGLDFTKWCNCVLEKLRWI